MCVNAVCVTSWLTWICCDLRTTWRSLHTLTQVNKRRPARLLNFVTTPLRSTFKRVENELLVATANVSSGPSFHLVYRRLFSHRWVYLVIHEKQAKVYWLMSSQRPRVTVQGFFLCWLFVVYYFKSFPILYFWRNRARTRVCDMCLFSVPEWHWLTK